MLICVRCFCSFLRSSKPHKNQHKIRILPQKLPSAIPFLPFRSEGINERTGIKSEKTTLYAEINFRSHKIGELMPLFCVWNCRKKGRRSLWGLRLIFDFKSWLFYASCDGVGFIRSINSKLFWLQNLVGILIGKLFFADNFHLDGFLLN